MTQAEHEGGLVDVLRQQRAELLASLALPAALAGWSELQPEELAQRFHDTPKDFQDRVYRSLGGLPLFLRETEQQIHDLRVTEAGDTERVRSSRAHALATQGFARSMTVNPQKTDVAPIVARNRDAFGDENVVVEQGGLYVAFGRVMGIDESAATIYLRQPIPETQPPTE